MLQIKQIRTKYSMLGKAMTEQHSYHTNQKELPLRLPQIDAFRLSLVFVSVTVSQFMEQI